MYKMTQEQIMERQRKYTNKWRKLNRKWWLNEHRKQEAGRRRRKILGLPKPLPKKTNLPGLIKGELRDLVLERDGYKCARCRIDFSDHIKSIGRGLSIHHIDGNGYQSKNPNNSLENLESLCNSCHSKEHKSIRRELKSVK